MNLNIILSTSEYRGDHNADVSVALAHIPGETIDQLVRRSMMDSPTDSLIIRIVRPVTTQDQF